LFGTQFYTIYSILLTGVSIDVVVMNNWDRFFDLVVTYDVRTKEFTVKESKRIAPPITVKILGAHDPLAPVDTKQFRLQGNSKNRSNL